MEQERVEAAAGKAPSAAVDFVMDEKHEESSRQFDLDIISPETQKAILSEHGLFPFFSTEKFVETYNGLSQQFEKHKEILLSIVVQAIRSTADRTIDSDLTKEELREIVALAKLQNVEFSKTLLGFLGQGKFLGSPQRMQALKAVLLALDVSFYAENIGTLKRITASLSKQLTDEHIQAQSYHEFIDTLEAIRFAWLAIRSAEAQDMDETFWKEQKEQFANFKGSDYQPIKYRADLLIQSLMHVSRSQEPQWKTNLLSGYKVITGIIMLAGALREGNISDAEDAALRIWDNVPFGVAREEPWFDAISALELKLIEALCYKKFAVLVDKILPKIIEERGQSNVRSINLSYGIFELVQRVALDRLVENVDRLKAISTLEDMYLNKEKWHADLHLSKTGRGNGDENLREQVLYTLFALRQDEEVGMQAKQALKNLYKSCQEKQKSKALNLLNTKSKGFEIINKFMPKGKLKDVSKENKLLAQPLERILKSTTLMSLPVGRKILGSFINRLGEFPQAQLPISAASPAVQEEKQADSPSCANSTAPGVAFFQASSMQHPMQDELATLEIKRKREKECRMTLTALNNERSQLLNQTASGKIPACADSKALKARILDAERRYKDDMDAGDEEIAASVMKKRITPLRLIETQLDTLDEEIARVAAELSDLQGGSRIKADVSFKNSKIYDNSNAGAQIHGVPTNSSIQADTEVSDSLIANYANVGSRISYVQSK